MKKTLLWILVLILNLSIIATFSLIGCEKAGEEGAEKEEGAAAVEEKEEKEEEEEKEEVTINVILDERDSHKVLEEQSSMFTDLTGIKVNFELLPETEMRDKINVDLMAQTGTYDVVWLGFMHETAACAGGLLEPLDDYVENKIDLSTGFVPENYFPRSGAFATDIGFYEGVRYTMPSAPFDVHDGLFLRADKLEEMGLTISDPPTIYEIEEIAKAFTDKENGIYGWAMRGIKGQNMWTFCPLAANFGAAIIDMETYEPLLNEPEMVEALEWYVMMNTNYGPPDIADWGWYEIMEGNAAGNIWMSMDAMSMHKVVVDVEYDVSNGNYGPHIQPIVPGNPMKAGYYSWNFAIPSAAKHKDEAWKFIQWCLSDEIAAGKWLSNANTAKVFYEKAEVYPGQSEIVDVLSKYVTSVSDEMYVVRKLPEAAEIMDILSTAISSAMSGEKTPQAALDQAADEMRSLLDSKGYY